MTEDDPTSVTVTVRLPNGFGIAGPDDGGAEYIAHLAGIGLVTYRAAMLEHTLRTVFCGLIDSPFASVTAAGTPASRLRDHIEAIAKARPDVTDDQRAGLRDILIRIKAALQQRNTYVHGIWAQGASGWQPLASRQNTHKLSSPGVVTPTMLATLATEMNDCAWQLQQWLVETLGHQALGREAALRWYEAQQHAGVTPPDEE